ncbi:MAG: bifunctional molybdenum cofactor biosynthesis protein MoaC/MoaB [Deltaproteobacteria bacterium]|nr:bifunctional molybdenum cofactor biosynthesis protein MoaC/MoaB [Deltaproteobacteria bacterium]
MAGESAFHMIDVGGKPDTHRRAVAQGEIILASDAFEAIDRRNNLKGDVLAAAEMAGIMTAKRTSELIPLCHPLPLESVRLSFTLDPERSSVMVFCEARTTGKTGVEMEALAGVNGALLSIYDLSKAVNPAIDITNVRLCTKEGGKSGFWAHPAQREAFQRERTTLENRRIAIVTVSDRCSRGEMSDSSGPALADVIASRGGKVVGTSVVADERALIQREVLRAAHELEAALVLTTGGTGLGARDVTPEALEEIYERPIPGIGQCLRLSGSRHTPLAWLSRGEAGLVGSTLVIPLPGSRRGALEGIEALEPILVHALDIIEGGAH